MRTTCGGSGGGGGLNGKVIIHLSKNLARGVYRTVLCASVVFSMGLDQTCLTYIQALVEFFLRYPTSWLRPLFTINVSVNPMLFRFYHVPPLFAIKILVSF